MARFENKMNISSLEMHPTVKCICTIGQTLCTYEMHIHFMPNRVIPDYLEVDEFINQMYGKEYTMEEAAAYVADYLFAEYAPVTVDVTLTCKDARHFPATVNACRYEHAFSV